MLIADEPLHAPSLRALARIDARQGARDGGRRFLELLAVAGQITDEERHLLSKAPPVLDEPGGTLDEDDHKLLAHSEALPLAGVFAALWEGTAAERAPGLESVGASASDRVSPVAANDLARAYSLCARLLGNRKTGLYLRPDPEFTRVALVAQPPTAIVVGPSLTDGRALADVRFVLGRALEIARPEYILAAALPPPEFTRLFAAILRAFHPRHARRAARSDRRGRRGGDVEARAAVQGRQAARRAVPRSGRTPSSRRIAGGARCRRRATARASWPRATSSRRRACSTPRATRTASRIWRASPPATITRPCGREAGRRPAPTVSSASDVSGTRHRHRRRRAEIRGARGQEAARGHPARPQASRPGTRTWPSTRCAPGTATSSTWSGRARRRWRSSRGSCRWTRRSSASSTTWIARGQAMKLCRVEGSVVATVHHPAYDGMKLLDRAAGRRRRLVPRGRPRAGRRRRRGAGESGGQRHAAAVEAGRAGADPLAHRRHRRRRAS